MKIVVTTPTGNIGSVVAQELMNAGAEVILPCRDPGKVGELTGRGAKAPRGAMDDAKFLTETLRGADALFWVTPPDFGASDYIARYREFATAGAAAVKENGIQRVVNVSSIGAQLDEGTGPVKGLKPIEKMFEEAAPDVTHLRAAFFFENYLPHVATIKEASSIFMPVPGSTKIPMIATRDIGVAAAKRLMDTSWTGHSAVGLHGPADLSFDEAAANISEGISRPVKHVTVAPDQVRQEMLGMGIGESITDLLLELYRSIETGHMKSAEPRTPETTTPTTMAAWAGEVLKPMLG